jgi:hypothetical protein
MVLPGSKKAIEKPKEPVRKPVEAEEIPEVEEEETTEETESEETEENQEQEVSTEQVLIDHEQRLRNIEAVFFRLKSIL